MHLQVETLAGKVVAVDVDAAASLGAMREGIARQTGIVVKQQRLIVLGTHISLLFASGIQTLSALCRTNACHRCQHQEQITVVRLMHMRAVGLAVK